MHGFLEWVRLIFQLLDLPDRTTSHNQSSNHIWVSLFKSQNGTTWDPSQYEDMKFILRKAKFNIGSPGTSSFL